MNTNVSLVTPRLDRKPWGGRKLDRYGVDLPPDEPVGEALVTAGEALVTAGYMSGRTLGGIVGFDPGVHLGSNASAAVGGRALFPLLVKLIDARENSRSRFIQMTAKPKRWTVSAKPKPGTSSKPTRAASFTSESGPAWTSGRSGKPLPAWTAPLPH